MNTLRQPVYVRIQEFSSVGGVGWGPGPTDRKKSDVFFLLFFKQFGVKWFISRKTINSQGSMGGGGPAFSKASKIFQCVRVGPIFNSYRS